MSAAGYTLAETLVALMIVGFTVGGVTASASVIGRMNTSTARILQEGGNLAQANRALDRLFSGQGPFNSFEPGVQGDEQSFGFDCQDRRCSASLVADGTALTLKVNGGAAGDNSIVMPKIRAARFSYVGQLTTGGVWPSTSDRKERLKSIIVVGVSPDGDVPLAMARVWSEQPHICQFDFVAQDCRPGGT